MKNLLFLLSFLFCISLTVSASYDVPTKATYTSAADDVSGFHADVLHIDAIDHGEVFKTSLPTEKEFLKDDINHQQEVEEVLKTHIPAPWKAFHCTMHNYLSTYYLNLINLHTRPPTA
jgi:hypothetical protein